MPEFAPDQPEFEVRVIDAAVLKDVALGALDWLASKIRPSVPFASHGDHTFEHPLDTPVTQPAQDWSDRVIPDVAGLDLAPNISLGEE